MTVAAMTQPPKTVQPIHFEDFDGFQFERPVFAYHEGRRGHPLSGTWETGVAPNVTSSLRPEVSDQTHLGGAHIALCLPKSAEIRWSCPVLISASTALAVMVEGVAMLSICTPLLVSRAT